MSDDPDKQSTVSQVGSWIWGTIEGGFNEQQSVSQIIVDAAISMIPVVGDVTAIRDLIAVILRLVDEPEKRKDKLEWVTLVLLLFALIPVAGGAIKGVGKLIVEAGEHAEMIRDIIQFLNRLGEGDAIKFLKALDFESHTAELMAQWRKLMQRLDGVLAAILRRAQAVMPDGMITRLQQIKQGLLDLAAKGEEMIPDALKELNQRLKNVQQAIYKGEWHDIPAAFGSHTAREAEARLVETIDKDKKVVKVWEGKNLPYPASTKENFHFAVGWPDLRKPPWLVKDTNMPWAIQSFSGEIKAVKIPAGTKIRRVVTAKSDKAGLFWSYELAKDGPTWRHESAVLERWSANGFYVELVVPDPGLWVLEGKIASQIDNVVDSPTFGQMLEGGATQLLIDFNMAEHAAAKTLAESLDRIPTNWTDLTNINVPAKTATVQKLGPTEIASKQGASAAAGIAQGASSGGTDDQPDQSVSPQ